MENRSKADDIEERINQIYGSDSAINCSDIRWSESILDPAEIRDDDPGIRTHNGFDVPIHGAGRFQGD